MREEFSKHCKQWRYREDVDENDFFVNAGTQRAWDSWAAAWQAAIASVVVDVESLPSASYTDDGVVYRSHVEDALEKAGIKCK